MIETEAKIKITEEDAAAVREKLGFLGAFAKPHVLHEINHVFAKPSRDRHPQDPTFRVRVHADSGEGLLTIKDIPPLSERQGNGSRLKKVEELLNIDLTRADLMVKALEENGFRKTFTYTKTREDWNYRNLLINIDELPRIGFFVEIEGEEKGVLEMVVLLGLSERPRHVMSYPEIYQDFKERGGEALWHPK